MAGKKTFIIHYGFDIKNPKAYDLAYYERGTFEMDADSMGSIDTSLVRQRIRQLAEKHVKKNQQIIYANYHKIEEKKGKSKNKKKSGGK